MCKLLILFVIPAVLSRSLQQDNAILANQFITTFVNAVKANDFSICAPDFEATVYDQNNNIIEKSSKEEIFQALRPAFENANGGQGLSNGNLNVVQNNGKLVITTHIPAAGKMVFNVTILGQNQFILNSISYYTTAA